MEEINKNSEFWNNRYKNDDTGWDMGIISTPIKAYFDQLTDKSLKILIPGCGNAHEAEYLFNQGFKNIFLVDLSPIALKNFRKRVPRFPDNQLICANFFTHEGTYDVMIEQTFFCAITPNLRAEYVKHSAQILKKEGKIIGLLFDEPLNEDHPPYGGSKAEYIEQFNPYFNIDVMEKAYNSVEPRAGRELFIKLTKKD